MSAEPITNAGRLARRAFYAALAPVVATFGGIPAAYWRVARDGAAAAILAGELAGMLVYQPQAPFEAGGTINQAESTGLIVVRAVATTDDAAETLLATALTAIASGLAASPGLAIQVVYTGEPPIPPADGLYTAAAQFRVTLRRT